MDAHETAQSTPEEMYRRGLMERMCDYEAGSVHLVPLPKRRDNDPLRDALIEGYLDADDDSDDPRPDDPAALQAMAREVFAELDRIGSDVSAWPDYVRGQLCLDDGLTSERHDAETLLATLRGLPSGAGAVAMWKATTPIAQACFAWNACAVVTEQSAAPAYSL